MARRGDRRRLPAARWQWNRVVGRAVRGQRVHGAHRGDRPAVDGTAGTTLRRTAGGDHLRHRRRRGPGRGRAPRPPGCHRDELAERRRARLTAVVGDRLAVRAARRHAAQRPHRDRDGDGGRRGAAGHRRRSRRRARPRPPRQHHRRVVDRVRLPDPHRLARRLHLVHLAAREGVRDRCLDLRLREPAGCRGAGGNRPG